MYDPWLHVALAVFLLGEKNLMKQIICVYVYAQYLLIGFSLYFISHKSWKSLLTH